MTRYNLLKESDLLKKRYYECVCKIGVNKNPRNMSIYFDEYGCWCIDDNVTIIAISDNSIMHVLKKDNHKRYAEVLQGGYYEDNKYESDYEEVTSEFTAIGEGNDEKYIH